MLYFSYGSNMSIKRLRSRVPSAQFHSVAKLQQHELRFHKVSKDGSGKCDIYETGNPEHYVLGVVFEISSNDKTALDKKEGLHHGYEEKKAIITTHDGSAISAVTYYATHINSQLKPYHWYKTHVLTGAIENKLPTPYKEAIETVESIPDPQPERHTLEMAIYQ